MIEALGRMVEQILLALLEIIEQNEQVIFASVIAFAVIVMILDSFYWIR